MNQPQKHQEHQVTLEDLLRLKRAERPSPDFWVSFDAELKRKQLAAAIVQRRPWWRLSPRFLRLALPVGAAAAVAVSFVAVRPQFSTPASAPISPEAPAPRLAAQMDAAPAPEMIDAPAEFQSSATVASATETSSPSSVTQFAQSDAAAATFVAAEVPRFASYSESLKIAPPVNGQDRYPTLNLPSVSLAAVTQSVSLQTSAVSESSSSQTDVWQDSRRARLQAYAEPALSSSNRDSSRVSRNRERVASRLNEQALSDSISRLGMADGRLLIRF